MGKKGKKESALVEDFQAMIKLVPKLKDLIKVHNDIDEGYQKYRKNGGEAIPGIEKHFCIKEQIIVTPLESKKDETAKEVKVPKENTKAKKAKK